MLQLEPFDADEIARCLDEQTRSPPTLSGVSQGLDTDLSCTSRDRDSRLPACCENFLYVFKAARNGPHAPPPGRAPAAPLSLCGRHA